MRHAGIATPGATIFHLFDSFQAVDPTAGIHMNKD
jgi:hypothetical protein